MEILISPIKGCSQLRINQLLTIYQGVHITQHMSCAHTVDQVTSNDIIVGNGRERFMIKLKFIDNYVKTCCLTLHPCILGYGMICIFEIGGRQLHTNTFLLLDP